MCEFCVAKEVQCDITAEVMYTCTLVYTVHVCTHVYLHVHTVGANKKFTFHLRVTIVLRCDCSSKKRWEIFTT